VLVALNVNDFLDRAATVYPQRVAIVDDPAATAPLGELTYSQFEARARGMALGLEAMGVAAGDRVAIVSPNAARFMISYFGVSGYGRVLVPVNYRLTADEVQYIVDHSGASVVLVDPEIADSLSLLRAKHKILLDGVDDAELFAPAPPGRQPEQVNFDENSTASINYTSGTTARPKGVQLTHRNCWINAAVFGWHTTVSEREVFLHTLPMFHCNGWGMPYAVTAMGSKQIVQRKIDGEQILERIDRHGVTLMCGAPAVVAAVLDAGQARRERGQDTPGRDRVRIVVAGAPPPSKVIERVGTELGWEFIQIYGLTETAPLLTVNRARAEWDGMPVGEKAQLLSRAGVPALGVRIATDADGEVLARSNHVFAGYWEQPEESAKALADGWFHTGDGGYVTGDSYLVISDRKKDVIITGGENVSSIEVEDCLYQHPDVAEVAVIGVPDDRWGETIKALVVLRPGATISEDDLIAFSRDRMAHFKCPPSVVMRDSLVRTATGKLQKFKLRAPYWEGRDRLVSGG
jgi:acyl-CoA synthetase (AMP-forming)/AMP-acid ligase II